MSQSKKMTIILWGFAILVLFGLAAIFGWQTFYGYVIPQANNLTALSIGGLYLFAFVAGLIANFGLCTLAILPAYLSFYLGLDDNNGHHSPIWRSLKLGFIASLGVFSFFIVLGVLFATAGTRLAAYSSQLKLVVTVIILLAGVSMIRNKSYNLSFLARFKNMVSKASTGGSRAGHVFGFGVLYGAGGLACFLPIFLPLILFPLLGGAFVTSIVSFLMFSLGQALFLTVATVLVGQGKHSYLKGLAGKSERMKKVAGWLLILTAIALTIIFVVVGM